MRSDCPAYITLRAAKCGQKLEVIDVCNQHNHPISEIYSRSLPQHRRLSPDVRKEVLLMEHVHIDRKKIIEYIRCKTGKELSGKDLLNLRASFMNSDQRLECVTDDTKKQLLQRIQLVCGEAKGKQLNTEFRERLEIVFGVNPNYNNVVETEEKAKEVGLIPDNVTQVVEEIVVENESFEQLQDYSIEMGDPFNSDANDDTLSETEEPHRTTPETNDNSPKPEVVDNQQELNNQGHQEVSVKYEPPSSPSGLLTPEFVPEAPSEPLVTPFTRKVKSRNFTRVRKPTAKKSIIRNCKHCGLNGKLVQMQIAVLRAEKEKLIEETHILRLTKERLMLQTGIGCVDEMDECVD